MICLKRHYIILIESIYSNEKKNTKSFKLVLYTSKKSDLLLTQNN